LRHVHIGGRGKKERKREAGVRSTCYTRIRTSVCIYTHTLSSVVHTTTYIGTDFFLFFFTLLFPFSLLLRGQSSIVRLWKFNFEILKEEGKGKKKEESHFYLSILQCVKKEGKEIDWTVPYLYVYRHYFSFSHLGFNYNQCLFETFGSIIITSWITYS
jgi:hypothetical protein